MNYLNTIAEYEGAVIDVMPRYWAAHQEAARAAGFEGPPHEEFVRLCRQGAAPGQMIPHAKAHHIQEYKRVWAERVDASDLMALDVAVEGAAANYRILKSMGNCHLATYCRNRDGINATLDRLNLWMHFDRKTVLPEEPRRRVDALREMAGSHVTLAIAGTVPFAYAASEAGCRVVALNRGPAFPRRLRQVGVDVFFESLDELTEALSRGREDLRRIGIC